MATLLKAVAGKSYPPKFCDYQRGRCGEAPTLRFKIVAGAFVRIDTFRYRCDKHRLEKGTYHSVQRIVGTKDRCTLKTLGHGLLQPWAGPSIGLTSRPIKSDQGRFIEVPRAPRVPPAAPVAPTPKHRRSRTGTSGNNEEDTGRDAVRDTSKPQSPLDTGGADVRQAARAFSAMRGKRARSAGSDKRPPFSSSNDAPSAKSQETTQKASRARPAHSQGAPNGPPKANNVIILPPPPTAPPPAPTNASGARGDSQGARPSSRVVSPARSTASDHIRSSSQVRDDQRPGAASAANSTTSNTHRASGRASIHGSEEGDRGRRRSQ